MPLFDTGGKRCHYAPHMATQTGTRFQQVVRKTLLDNKVAGTKPDSIRSLARKMAKGDQLRADTFKRSLFKWMAPGEPNPSPASRALVADALGVKREELEDDDEESDPVAVLMNALRRVVRDELNTREKTEPTASLAKATAGSNSYGG